MTRVEKTVFISYRRSNASWALAISQNLTKNGFDVFFDYKGIASGDFEKIILENIRARAHFLVLLTHSALDRCDTPGDLFRREIEEALETKRNVVPLLLEGFDFGAPRIVSKLTGQLALLQRYNGLTVPAEYFDAAMTRLREEFLHVPLDAVLHPASEFAQRAAKDQQVAAAATHTVKDSELTAEVWAERGFHADGWNETIRCYTEALRLKPDFAAAYHNRGVAHGNKGDHDGAIADYTEALRLRPYLVVAYVNRGAARTIKGDYDGAITDYTDVLRIIPDDAKAYFYRGAAHAYKGDYDRAITDYTEALRLQPDDAKAYFQRGIARAIKGDHDDAIIDWNEALRLQPDDAEVYYNLGLACAVKGDYDGAITDCAEAIRLRPDDAKAYFHRGVAHGNKGNYEGAITDYTEALRLQPNLAEAYYYRSRAHQSKGDMNAAQRDYTRAVSLQLARPGSF